MVLQKEFRIVMPLSLEKYDLGQKYSTARMSKETTEQSGGQDGVELLESKTYFDEKYQRNCLYQHKIYYVGGSLPGWLKAILPASTTKLEEKSWNAYPYCKTELSNPFLGQRFLFTIETIHVENDLGDLENVHNLEKKALKERKVEKLDIANDVLSNKKQALENEEPTKITHTKATLPRKAPLSKTWIKEIGENAKNDIKEPYVCCYKLVTVKFNYPGFSSKVENYLMTFEHDIFLNFHRKMYAWLDEWYDLTLDDILASEKQMWQQTGTLVQKPAENGKQEVIEVPNNENVEEKVVEKDENEVASDSLTSSSN